MDSGHAHERLDRGRCRGERTRERQVSALSVLAVTFAYVSAGKLGLELAFAQANATAIWAPAGIALAALLLCGYRIWPAILLGAFLVNVTTAGSIATSGAIAIGNTLEAVVGAYLVRRFCAGVRAFERPQDVLKFAALAGVIGPAVSATVGVTSLSLGGFSNWAEFGSVWSTWWLGDLGGILIVAPLLVLWGTDPRLRWSRKQAFEVGLLALVLAFTGAAVFGDLLPTDARLYALDFMAVPPLVWAAFRFEHREAATAAFALSGIALWGTLHGLGPFVRANPNESLLLLQSFMGATSLMALLFAALVSNSRQLSAARLLEERLRFETLLSELTAGLIHVPASGIDSALEAGLRDVVTFLVVDRGNLDEYLDGGLETRIAWASPGLEEPPRVMEADQFPWAAERLRRGEVVRFSRVDELPEEAAVDRASYQRSGTRSKVSLPLQAGGRVLGALSFGSVRRERTWPGELVERLRLLSEAFASALERKRMDLSLAERLRFEKLLSNLTAAFRDVSVIDFDREIRDGLHRVVEFLAADRGSLIEFSRDRGTVRSWAIEEWIDVDEFPWLTARLQRGDSVTVSSLDELPRDAEVDRRSYLAYRVKPSLAVPLLVSGTVVGGLVLSAIGVARASSEELMRQLNLLAEVFANALSRRQVELEAQRLRQDLAHIGRISAVGELTASLAHDLSQPLAAILSNAQAGQRLLAAEPVNLPEVTQILADIVEDDKRAGAVIHRLRALLKRGDFEQVSLELNETVSEVARLVRSDAVIRNVTMTIELAGGLPRVRGDRVQLQQVLLNLVLNGLDAMREPHTGDRNLVIRTARSTATTVRVAVEDSGSGIDEEHAEKVFQPLYTTKVDGLGMGLAIARTIVEAHGGTIAAQNNAHGGATFSFALPIASEAP
jgi:signal transduction histidine kinase/integral membrane sensor domain MASE1